MGGRHAGHHVSLRLTERLRRRDYGHLDYEITVDDPKVTPIGLEFFKDSRGTVTHVVVRGGAAAEQKAVRKN